MASSPPRRPDPLKDAEARIRALTREVGTLREDLRREVKRRDRAAVQASGAEDARKACESRAQELAYSNKKLAAELDALHETARASAERDRRTLRSLREGLAAVEAAVAQRAQKGYTQVRVVYDSVQQLRALLFTPSELLNNVAAISSAIAPRADQLLSALADNVSQLAALLSGPTAAASRGMGEEEDGGEGGTALSVAVHEAGLGAAASIAAAGGIDMEKEQLRDEVVRLRAEIKLAADRAAGAASTSALELQQSLQASKAEVVRLKAEVVHLNAQLAAAHRAAQDQEGVLQHAHQRLSAQDQVQAQLVVAARHQQDDSLGVVAELQTDRVALQEELTAALRQVSVLQMERAALLADLAGCQKALEAAQHELHASRASISQQREDIHSALQLIARPAAGTGGSGVGRTPAPYPAQGQAGGAAPPAGASSSIISSVEAPPLPASLPAALSLLPYYSNASSAISSALAAAAALAPPPPAHCVGGAALDAAAPGMPVSLRIGHQPPLPTDQQPSRPAYGEGVYVPTARQLSASVPGPALTVLGPTSFRPADYGAAQLASAAPDLRFHATSSVTGLAGGSPNPATRFTAAGPRTAAGGAPVQRGDARSAVAAAAAALQQRQHSRQAPGSSSSAYMAAGPAVTPRPYEERATSGSGAVAPSSVARNRVATAKLPLQHAHMNASVSQQVVRANGGGKQLVALRKDMLNLDDEIAALEESLKSAAARM